MMRFALDSGVLNSHHRGMSHLRPSAQRSSAGVAFLMVVAGCSSGQTGSPDGQQGSEGPLPDYTSPTRFAPTDPDNTGGENGFGEDWFYFEQLAPEAQRLMHVQGDHLFVVVAPEEYTGPRSFPRELGLVVFDISDPLQPKSIGELPLPGYPRQMYADENGLNLIIEQHNEAEYSELPDNEVPYQVTRLLRIDTSDPEQAKVSAQIDVEGNYSRSYLVDGGLAIVSETPGKYPTECYTEGAFVGDIGRAPPPGTAHVSVYSYASGEWKRSKTLDLEGYVQPLAARASRLLLGELLRSEEGDFSTRLSLVELGETPEVSAELELPGSVTAAAIVGDGIAATFEQEGRYSFHSLEASPSLRELDSFQLPARVAEMTTVGSAVVLSPETIEAGTASYLVPLATSPLGAYQLPAMQAFSLEDADADNRFLAMTRDDTGRVRLELYQLGDAGPELVAEASTNWAHTASRSARYVVTADGAGQLLYPYSFYDGATGQVHDFVGAAKLDQAAEMPSLQVGSGVETRRSQSAPAANGSAVFTSGPAGLTAALLDGSESRSLDLYPQPKVVELSSTSVADFEVKLQQVSDEVRLRFETENEEPIDIELEHFGEEVITVGERVIVMGLRRPSDCDFLGEIPEADLFCPKPNVAGISVFDVSAEPKLVWKQTIASDFGASELPPDSRYTTQFLGYLPLQDDKILFPVSQTTHCETREACEELGISGSEGQASPGCNPETQNCDELPAVINFFSGAKNEPWLYVLDLSADKPKLKRLVELADRFELHGEDVLSVEGQVVRSGNFIGFPRYEYLESEDEIERARHWMDYVELDFSEGLAATTVAINTPGQPLQLLDKGRRLLSIEPSADDDFDAMLHLSSLRGGGAFIDASENLGQGFRDAVLVEGHTFLLFGPQPGCSDEPVSRVFSIAVESDELDVLPALKLPGDDWLFAWWERPWPSQRVLLRGGPAHTQGRLQLDVSQDEAAPQIERYFITK